MSTGMVMTRIHSTHGHTARVSVELAKHLLEFICDQCEAHVFAWAAHPTSDRCYLCERGNMVMQRNLVMQQDIR